MNRAAIAEARKPFGAESVCAVERASAVETFATASVFANVARRVRSAGAVSGRRETTMANEPKGPSFGYRRERWEAQNESVVIGPGGAFAFVDLEYKFCPYCGLKIVLKDE